MRRAGARFQPIDLRWGVRDETALDQRTVQICLEEIARCREVSPRLSFVALLGDRYGGARAPFRTTSPDEAWDALLAAVGADDAGRIAELYRRDANAVPAAWRLRRRRGWLENPDAWAAVERSALNAIDRVAATEGLRAPVAPPASATAREFGDRVITSLATRP